ncbi:MAG: hypothetical protein IT469_02500 [Pseudomonadales bacterium]|nr:hypothetical protein [Pseudomonadales bacterium]
MEHCVFIQANRRQWLGAVVAAHALRRNSCHPERFAVRIMQVEDFPCLQQREGQRFLRGGEWRVWRNDDLQSFTPLRFAPPELMDYQGRALVIDPDVFAQGDVWELLSRDLGGHAILCRAKTGRKGKAGAFATSVMLLDCAQLRHWNLERDFGALFRGERDYMDWIGLHLEDPATIGPLEPEWNDFDHLTPRTRMLHNTKRWTQPWKTGLPVDFRPADSFRLFPPRHWLRRARRALFGDYRFAGHYRRHPDPAQERVFFRLLGECLAAGVVDEARLRAEIASRHLRPDAFEVLARVAA